MSATPNPIAEHKAKRIFNTRDLIEIADFVKVFQNGNFIRTANHFERQLTGWRLSTDDGSHLGLICFVPDQETELKDDGMAEFADAHGVRYRLHLQVHQPLSPLLTLQILQEAIMQRVRLQVVAEDNP